VGIKMAKEQGLALNPVKISGVCGRLMCCLGYEFGFYHDARQSLPKVGSQVITAKGQGKIVDINVPKQMLVVNLAEGGQVVIAAGEAQRLCHCPCDQPCVHVGDRAPAAQGEPKAAAADKSSAQPQAASGDGQESTPRSRRSGRRRRRRRPRRSSGEGG
jgi:hypothetical protein